MLFLPVVRKGDSDVDDCDKQSCGSGSVMDPYSGDLWIQIRNPNTDPDPHM